MMTPKWTAWVVSGTQSRMRISRSTRDALSRIAERDFGGACLEETVLRLVWEHESFVALTGLDEDGLRRYREEHAGLAEVDVDVPPPGHATCG